MSEITGGGRAHTRVKVKLENDEATKAEMRRWKNREAARRVRERKNCQLNSYKAQVDDLKKENQKLLQIIAQLRSTTLSPASVATTTVTEDGSAPAGQYAVAATAGQAATPSLSGVPDSIDSNPSAAAAAAAAAAAVDQVASGSLMDTQPVQHVMQPHVSGPLQRADSDAAVEKFLSQQGLASSAALLSSCSLIPLAGTMSAPLPQATHFCDCAGGKEHGRPALAPDEVPLVRACGCTGDEECDDCEGIRVTIQNSSSLPLVTTPGPKPKPLTLEDLCLPGAVASHSNAAAGRASSSTGLAQQKEPHDMVGSVYSHPQLALLQQQQRTSSTARSQQQQQQHKKGQQRELAAMDLDLVETLEMTRGPNSARASRLDSNSSSGNAVQAAQVAHEGAARRLAGSCYVRKSSLAVHGTAAAIAEHPTGPGPEQQGKQKLRRRHTTCMDTASAAAAALAADPLLAVELLDADDAGVTGSVEVLLDAAGLEGDVAPVSDGCYIKKEPEQAQQQQQQHLSNTGKVEADERAAVAAGSTPMAVDDAAAAPAVYQQLCGSASNAAEMHHHQQQQQQQQKKKGHKLFRSLAAAVNGLIRPNNSSAGGNCGVAVRRMHNADLSAGSAPIEAAAAAAGTGVGGYTTLSTQSARFERTLGDPAGFLANNGASDMQASFMQQQLPPQLAPEAQQQQQQVAGEAVVQRKRSVVGESPWSSDAVAAAVAALQGQQQVQTAEPAATAAAVDQCVPAMADVPSMHDQIQQLQLQIQAQQVQHAAQQAQVQLWQRQQQLQQQQQQQQSAPGVASSLPLPFSGTSIMNLFNDMSADACNLVASLSASGCYAAMPAMTDFGSFTGMGGGGAAAATARALGGSSSLALQQEQQQQQQALSSSIGLSGGGHAACSADGQQRVLSGSHLSANGNAVFSSGSQQQQQQQQQQLVLSGGNLSSSGTVLHAGGAGASLSGSMLPVQHSAAAAAAMSMSWPNNIASSTPAAISRGMQLPPAYTAGAGNHSWPASVGVLQQQQFLLQHQQQQQQQYLLQHQQQQQGLWPVMLLNEGTDKTGEGLRGFSIIEGAAEGSDEDAVMQLAMQEGVLLQ